MPLGGFAFGHSPGDVGAAVARVAAFPGDRNEVQCLVERAVAVAVEALALLTLAAGV